MQSSMRCRNACNQAWGVKMHATKYEVLKCMQLRIRCLNACNQAWSLGIYRTKQEVSKCMQPKGCYAWLRSVQLGQVVSALAMLDTRLIIESKSMEKIKNHKWRNLEGKSESWSQFAFASFKPKLFYPRMADLSSVWERKAFD